MQNHKENPFLNNLLGLQQDGNQAISAPTNWTKTPPLLEVETKITSLAQKLSSEILIGPDNNRRAKWHFFIGSPGNGKSAAIGRLYREIIKKTDCIILDEEDRSVDQLSPDTLPYKLHVFESDNKFSSLIIVQDASVVSNPFSNEINPSQELLEVLKSAWLKGVSLVICSNRGIVEKAYRDNYLNDDVKNDKWFEILHRVATSDPDHCELGEFEFTGKKRVFEKVQITLSQLDNESLLTGENNETFSMIVDTAVDSQHWDICQDCSAIDNCPFYANKRWLVNVQAKNNFLKIMRRAEALSGQTIVFREALALISFILAGNPRDYHNQSPCGWVHSKIETDDFIGLAMRRIYMSLFCSHTKYGLEPFEKIQQKQRDSIKVLRHNSPRTRTLNMINNVLNTPSPSSDAGVTRLLGPNGILQEIDFLKTPMTTDFIENWNSSYEDFIEQGGELVSGIEKELVGFFFDLEDIIENSSDYQVAEAFRSIKRWSSNFLIHFGILFEGLSAWSDELDNYIEILQIVQKPNSQRSHDEKKKIHSTNEELEKLLLTDDADRIPLAGNRVTLYGPWVHRNLKPKINNKAASSNLSLHLKFNEQAESAELSSRAYVWLSRHAKLNLNIKCIPRQLLTGVVDARIRAASQTRGKFKNSYAGDTEVYLEIVTKSGSYIVHREDGDAFIDPII